MPDHVVHHFRCMSWAYKYLKPPCYPALGGRINPITQPSQVNLSVKTQQAPICVIPGTIIKPPHIYADVNIMRGVVGLSF